MQEKLYNYVLKLGTQLKLFCARICGATNSKYNSGHLNQSSENKATLSLRLN